MQEVPISIAEDGTWRVKGSRVTVDVVLGQFLRGSTPEQIQDDFSTLSLANIYGLISYYLSHQEEVETYLREREKNARVIREKWDNQPGVQQFREKIREARDSQGKE